jgi:hypothetical protein
MIGGMKMLKKISAILLTLLLILVQMPSLKANASDATIELKINTVLAQWILDEPANTLYAISHSGKNLIFINATTMNIEKTLAFNGTPTDIILDNGKLYISLADINQIAVVDMASRAITKTLRTSSDAYRIVKEGDTIYYTERDQWCNIYEYNLLTNTDKMIPTGILYNPDLAINPKDHILYIAESGSSGSDMVYYSTSEKKIISQTNYDNGYGFPYPERYVIFDGEKVYYAGFALDKLNAANILGKYGNKDIIFVKQGNAFAKRRLYNSSTYELLAYTDIDINLYETSESKVLYLYSEGENSIVRIDPSKIDVSKKGWFQENGKWYYYEVGLKKTGWLYTGGAWYYLKDDGSMATGWIKQGNTWYYLQNSGAMKTGWLLDGGSWYYLENSGRMKTGWLLVGGNWYYLESSGRMKTGWIFSGSKWYYLYSSGQMAVNTRIDGYKFGADGAWIP